MDQEKIVEIKPNFWGISLDLGALVRRLAGLKNQGRVGIVADRFLTVFSEHGVAPSQIPQLLPEISLDKINSDEQLLRSLTSSVLTKVSTLFRVRREWLEGVENRIYNLNGCYKTPGRFFEALRDPETEIDRFPFRIFHSEDLDFRKPHNQPMVMLLVEKVQEIGEEVLYRYQIWDECDWSYPPCRIQLKAMVRVFNLSYNCGVPLYRVPLKDLNAIIEGKCIPARFLRRSPKTDPSLEDYALGPEESRAAKETKELSSVLQYIERHNLTI